MHTDERQADAVCDLFQAASEQRDCTVPAAALAELSARELGHLKTALNRRAECRRHACERAGGRRATVLERVRVRQHALKGATQEGRTVRRRLRGKQRPPAGPL